MVEPGTSGCTGTIGSTVADSGLIHTWPKTIPLDQTNTHTHKVHALY